jgi:hypothetical protein
LSIVCRLDKIERIIEERLKYPVLLPLELQQPLQPLQQEPLQQEPLQEQQEQQEQHENNPRLQQQADRKPVNP